jgi:hypothetical protein
MSGRKESRDVQRLRENIKASRKEDSGWRRYDPSMISSPGHKVITDEIRCYHFSGDETDEER